MSIRIQKIFFFLSVLFFTVSALAWSFPFPKFFGNHWKESPEQTAATLAPATQIALLVPLQGPLASTGQAIRNGFLAAYYYAKDQQMPVPSISVLDTSSGDIVSLYEQAIEQGADFIVGPLTKEELQTLSRVRLTVPTLALNTLDNPNASTNNLYQFSLSPQDEAAQAAEKAFQDGHRRALIITPQGEWGQGIARAFAQHWQELGGIVLDSYAYRPKADYSAGIHDLLQVTEHKAENAPSTAKPIPVHRQDADMIFLAAFPQQARQIRPMLLFYNAGDIPVYATSLIYAGISSPVYDQDLNGIIFADMPWILNYNANGRLSNIHQRVISLWGNAFDRSPRLYGFGVDAYSIASEFNQIDTGLSGATGGLALGQNGHVTRQLVWAQIRNGIPILISN